MKIRTVLVVGICLSVLLSCRTRKDGTETDVLATSRDSADFSHPVGLKYAGKLLVVNHPDYKEIYILNPVGSDTLATYILTLHPSRLPVGVATRGQVIRVPVRTMVCLSPTQVGALEVLGLRDRLVGAANTDRFWDKELNKRIADGRIKEVSPGIKPDMERILVLNPDVVVKNDHNKNIKDQEMEAVGIHTVFYNDWRENTLLARAEWLKMMGMLFCRNRQADSLFCAIVSRYGEVRGLATGAEEQPDVFIAQEVRGIWYVPGNESYLPAMIADANARVTTLEGTGTSLPCNFEKVFETHRKDKYWLSLKAGMVTTLKDFGAACEHYGKFDAFRSGNVFINNKRLKPGGGNDFWESGTFQPDVVLKDLIKIFHPEVLPGYETYYWRKLD